MSKVHIERTPLVHDDGARYAVKPQFFTYGKDAVAKRTDITEQKYSGEWYEAEYYMWKHDMALRIMVPARFVEQNSELFEKLD